MSTRNLGGHARWSRDKFGNVDVHQVPQHPLFLRLQPPTAGTTGTTFDHIGFAVPNVPETTAKVVANGYKLTVGREIAGQAPPAPATGGSAVYGKFSYLVGPDGVKVELVTSSESNAPPITHHHGHGVNKQYVEMQQWYMKAFDATLRPGRRLLIGADLRRWLHLNYFRWEWTKTSSSRGPCRRSRRVRGENLEDFCRKLEAKGIT